MKIVFRADASTRIGTGHVMRCLTLAHRMKRNGHQCEFICRDHPGNLISAIEKQEFAVSGIPVYTGRLNETEVSLPYGSWLGGTQADDASQCLKVLENRIVDWVVVDHYGLDAQWELVLKKHCRKLMVVDDLADRSHCCDLLLDQTLGRNGEVYNQYVSVGCVKLCGSNYALLRPEFAELREYSFSRRKEPQLKSLLVSLGGVDKDNVTSSILRALKLCGLPEGCQIQVVMGATAPWLDEIREVAGTMPNVTRVHSAVQDMAQLMADCDLAIGAAGSTAWERACLGLPSIMVVLAPNQQAVARALDEQQAAVSIRAEADLELQLRAALDTLTSEAKLYDMSLACRDLVDGMGAQRVARVLEQLERESV